MTQHPDGLMVLGMGGGKTAATLTAFKDLRDFRLDPVDRMIVLAPARVVDNVWPNEPRKWAHLDGLLNVRAIVGPPQKRIKLLEDDWDVAVVSIDNTQWLVDHLMGPKKRPPSWLGKTLLVIDEMSKFKNPRSKRGKALLKLQRDWAGTWGLTGTPRPNGWEDVYLPIKLIGGEDVWGERSFDKWRRANFMPMDYQGYTWKIHGFAEPKIAKTFGTFASSASVDDLEKPELRTGDDYLRTVSMSDEQRVAYESMVKNLVAEITQRKPKGDILPLIVQAMSQGVASGKLSQIVQGFMYDDRVEGVPFQTNPKLDMLTEMDEELGGDSAVICYGLRAEIPQIQAALRHRTTGLLGGGVSATKAKQTIDAWNNGEIDRLLIHPASAGHGIELQFGGHHMIWYHPTWSSEMFDQTVKRLDRPGQTHAVTNWQIIMSATIDEIKYARVGNKMLEEDAVRRALRNVVV